MNVKINISKFKMKNLEFEIQNVRLKIGNAKFARPQARTNFEFRFDISDIFSQLFPLTTYARVEKAQS